MSVLMKRTNTHDFVGPALRSIRTDAGMSLTRVAERAGVSKGHLSRIERGLAQPSLEMVATLADALDSSLSAIVARARGMEQSR